MAAVMKRMQVSDWNKIPENPRQRDTERHARKAILGHLSEFCDSQLVVHAAMVDGQIRWKLDGHTRAFLWESGQIPIPRSKLYVMCHEVEDEEEAKELYTHFDNQSAVENAKDRLFGACREAGMTLESPLLAKMQFVVALRLASGEHGARAQKTTEYQLVKLWQHELEEVDGWGLTPIPGPCLAVALMAVRHYGQERTQRIREFFERLISDRGVKTPEGRDGVQALNEHLTKRRAEKTLTGWDNLIDLAEKCLSCLSAFIEDRTVSQVRRMSVAKFITPVTQEDESNASN